MADYYYGNIEIPAKFLTHEKRMLINEELHKLQEYTLDELDQDSKDGDDILVLSKPETRDGKFEELEHLLVQHNIPFNRYSSGYYEFQPERRYFRPGVCDREIVESEHDGEYIPHDKIKELLAVILDENKGREDAIEMANKLIDEYTSEGIPPLEDYI